jgi:branched-chain amino acid transport system permease protein
MTDRAASGDVEPLPGRQRDPWPLTVVIALVVAALPAIGDVPTWATLTVAAVAMGMMLFIMSSGLTLIFGLMDVMNFGHASLVAVGAYTATLFVPLVAALLNHESLTAGLLGVGLVLMGAAVSTGAVGWLFERLFVRRLHGDHVKQILITVGALLIIEQSLIVLFGPNQMSLPLPEPLRGSIHIGDVSVERYRIVAALLGLLVYAGLHMLLKKSRIGLLIRAGVENREMVEALGYPISNLFLAVFVGGCALAGLGGAMWGFYREQFTSQIGAEVLVQMLVIVIIGGLGSVRGCLLASLLVGLVTNYLNFLLPEAAILTNILAMMLVLLWRPRGLYDVGN